VIDLINGVKPEESQFRFDISFGPPPIYRKEVLAKALAVLGPEMLQFGSDRFLPCSGDHIRSMIEEVKELLEALDLSSGDQENIFHKTASSWLKL
jgi:hypothetical protein